ncbi:MAG: adenylate/guanylate cyclase domain-containing protein, partial [Thermoplasmata archaeon]
SGGIVEKFLGDGFLAVFGIPHSHEDDPQRALGAALECVLAAHESRSKGGHLAIRVAIETGEALVEVGARGGDREHGIVGVCVNFASRLQAEAADGEVLVGPACHEVAADLGEFESVGPFDLKGLGRVPGWRLVRLLEAHSTVRPPFVGRRSELEVLTRS